jgi:hypothetical protein
MASGNAETSGNCSGRDTPIAFHKRIPGYLLKKEARYARAPLDLRVAIERT